MNCRTPGLILLLPCLSSPLTACRAARTAPPAPRTETGSESAGERPPAAVAARGRLEPEGGVLRVSGPSDFVVVVGRLEVGLGDRVEAGQVLARTDAYPLREARVASLATGIESQQAAIRRLQAELENARVEERRLLRLSGEGIVADSDRDAAETRRKVAEASLAEARSRLAGIRADLATARADAELAVVRAPRAGQVLKVHAHRGEKVGPEGILDLGTTQQMYAIAEVYETDVGRVHPGQRARVRSPALPGGLGGTVERVGLEVGRLRSLGTNPALKSDARVVEVEIRLDDSSAAASLTYLEVEVLILP
jgi:HlyD family secretion protein